jgi:hypothetical protein
MFKILSSKPDTNAMAVLKHDHEKVKSLFEKFEKAETLQDKKRITANIIKELKVHAAIEEEIFYPALRSKIESDLLNEADEEHHVAKLLIAELEEMTGNEMHFEAKVTVLAENIKHHIKEEEHEIMSKAKSTDIDFDLLGEKLLKRKAQLMKNGVPLCAEEKMIFSYSKNNDSPAQAAKTHNTTKKAVLKPKKATKAVQTTAKTKDAKHTTSHGSETAHKK